MAEIKNLQEMGCLVSRESSPFPWLVPPASPIFSPRWEIYEMTRDGKKKENKKRWDLLLGKEKNKRKKKKWGIWGKEGMPFWGKKEKERA